MTARERSATGICGARAFGLDVASGNRLSGLELEDMCSSSLAPAPSSSLPGRSGVNDRRMALVGAAAREEDNSEDEMTSYLNRSAKVFS